MGRPPADCEIVDAGGTTIVPGMVDGHSHLTLPDGSHWIGGGSDPDRDPAESRHLYGKVEQSARSGSAAEGDWYAAFL